jgi:hypothetical protein
MAPLPDYSTRTSRSTDSLSADESEQLENFVDVLAALLGTAQQQAPTPPPAASAEGATSTADVSDLGDSSIPTQSDTHRQLRYAGSVATDPAAAEMARAADAEGTAATTSRETGATAIADHSTPANGDLDHHPASNIESEPTDSTPFNPVADSSPEVVELPPASTGSKDDKPAEIVPSTEVTVERVKSDAVEAEGTLALRDGTVQAAQATIDVNQRSVAVDAELRQLRDILVGLEDQLYDPNKLVKLLLPALAEAMRERIKQRQGTLANVLRTDLPMSVEEQIAIERDASLTPCIRLLVQRFRNTLRKTLRTIKGKVARATGTKPLRQVGLDDSSDAAAGRSRSEAQTFSVRVVFLIHKASGLVLTEVLPAQGYGLDLETKTGMLTAIRSFADSKLTHADEGSPLNAIAFDQTSQIILELGQSCYLAVVVKGDPPISYLQRVEQRLQEIEDGYAEPIQTYEGDPSTVPVEIQTDLQPLLVIDPKRSKQRRPLMVVELPRSF